MRTPRNPIEKVQYFEDHLSPWVAHAVAMGTTEAAVEALSERTVAARQAYDAQQIAQQAARAATLAFHNAVDAMNVLGQGILKQLDATAQVTANPSVYTLAQVSPRATPTAAGTPGVPSDFSVSITSTGALSLKWKNRNASGCFYTIRRRLGETGEFEPIGRVGRKAFTDQTIPAGTGVVHYQVQAIRSTGASESAIFVVHLGVDASMAPMLRTSPAMMAA